MTVRPIVVVPDARLKKVSKPVEAVTDEHRVLMDDMLDSMHAVNGIGLAAIQIGELLRVVVMDLAGPDEEPQPRYLVNPEIYDSADVLSSYEEGCLSIPEQFASVDRPETCRVRYLDYDGAAKDELCEGMFARCIQHEVDHLNGILFVDYLSSVKRNMMIRKVQKSKRQDSE